MVEFVEYCAYIKALYMSSFSPFYPFSNLQVRKLKDRAPTCTQSGLNRVIGSSTPLLTTLSYGLQGEATQDPPWLLHDPQATLSPSVTAPLTVVGANFN